MLHFRAEVFVRSFVIRKKQILEITGEELINLLLNSFVHFFPELIIFIIQLFH